MTRKSIASIAIRVFAIAPCLVGFSTGFSAGAQVPLEHENGESIQRNGLSADPARKPNWAPPSLPPGAVAAEEVGSFQSRRDHEIDYPREARIARREGVATIGITIDQKGQISDCLIVESSGDSYLDTGSCALILARGRYKPALDANGNPMISGKKLQIDWDIDWDTPQAPADSLIRLSYTVHPDGSSTDCWVDRGEGTQGVSHPEMCKGSAWQGEAFVRLQELGGSGDMRVSSVTGGALSDATMSAQIAERPGWHRFMGSAGWFVVDEQGVAGNCQEQPFPGQTRFEMSRCDGAPPPQFAPPLTTDGKPTQVRFGRSFAWYVEVPKR